VIFTQIKVEAFADTVAGVEYYDRDAKEIKTVSAEAVKDTMTTWGEENSASNPKWYVVQQGKVETASRIIVKGNVHLILADGAELKAKEGIDVSTGNSLTIYAQRDMVTENTGKIEAEINGKNAGIGGSENKEGGIIKITGGKVKVKSQNGAGIGGGSYAAGGNIEITGGDVKAKSRFGAGIGGGREAPTQGSPCNTSSPCTYRNHTAGAAPNTWRYLSSRETRGKSSKKHPHYC